MAALTLPNRPKIIGCNFDLYRPVAQNPNRGGWHQSVAMGEPLWTCEIATTDLDNLQAGEYKWLFNRAQDSDQTVYIYDAWRAYPARYAPGGGWGNPVVAEVDRANSRIRVTGFVAGAVISAGDMGHWDDTPARRLHMCGPVVANGSGEAWISVRPPPPETATVSLPVPFVMAKAAAEMKIVQSQVARQGFTAKATLTAGQVIRRY